jgi:integrase
MQVHRVLHRALRFAVLWRWLPDNPADRVLKPVYRSARRDVWTPEQARTFLAGTQGHRLGALWAVLTYTGLRLGECLALLWQDVDLDAGTLTVRRTVARIRGAWVESLPKTQAGERVLTLPSAAVAALRHQRARQAGWRLAAGSAWIDQEAVFTGRLGQTLLSHDVQRRTRELCLRLKLPPLTPHGLRHLHASVLLAEGLPLPAVSARLGHADPSITARVYSHALQQQDQQAAALLQRVLSPDAGGDQTATH